jgi:hypothetical protein
MREFDCARKMRRYLCRHGSEPTAQKDNAEETAAIAITESGATL